MYYLLCATTTTTKLQVADILLDLYDSIFKDADITAFESLEKQYNSKHKNNNQKKRPSGIYYIPFPSSIVVVHLRRRDKDGIISSLLTVILLSSLSLSLSLSPRAPRPLISRLMANPHTISLSLSLSLSSLL